MRKRWSVVIVGQSGLALSHRAEVGRHRSEAAARRAAEAERDRLHARGDTVQGYRVVLEHDGQEVALDPTPQRAGPASNGARNGTPREARAEHEERPAGDERRGRPERAAPSVRPDVRRAATISIPDPPPGPVPEEILARWARERPPEHDRS